MSQTLTLKDVERLGGTKEEYERLGALDSASDMEFGDEEVEGEEDDSQRAEIEAFIRSIGLNSRTRNKNRPEEKKTTESKVEEKENKQSKKKKKDDSGERENNSSKFSGERVDTGQKKKRKERRSDDGKGGRETEYRKERKGSQLRVEIQNSEMARSGRSDVEKQLVNLTSSSSPHKKLLVSPDSEQSWFDLSVTTEPGYSVSDAVLLYLKSLAQQLMKNEVEQYDKFRERRKGASDVKWLKNVLSSGTLNDKVAAHTLLVQESPVHSLVSLDWLLGMVSKGGGVGKAMKGLHAKRKGILATNTLKELWVTELLPEHRKLKYLNQRPLHHLLLPPLPPSSSSSSSSSSWQSSLLLWYYEDQIKSRYLQFVKTLQEATHDPTEEVREKMVGHVFDLLHQRPEQEKLLLTQLVNKLGDPHRKVASKAVMFLLKLLNHHVNMKMVVTREVESLLYRHNISTKAQYYSVCCLNQLVLSAEEGPLVAKLMDVYFTFFKTMVNVDKGGLESKMMAALLTGVNRAFPYMSEELPSFEDHLDTLFKAVHVAPIATGVQCLMLLYQVMESRHSVSDRYYNALYSKLLDPALKHCSKQAMFLNILFKSLKSDPSINRVKAFVKRILYVCSCHSPSFVCGCLVLLSELLKEKPILWPFVLQSNEEEVFGDEEEEEKKEEGEKKEKEKEEEGDRRNVTSNHDRFRIGHRNPQFCGAETTCLWELSELCQHYHPSVQLFSKKIVSGEAILYASDPLTDFSTIKFLDRFVYKNPKTRSSDHGGSVMQRLSRVGMTSSSKELMANSAAFAAMSESKVDVKDLFMHKFLTQRGKVLGKRKKRKKKKLDGDDDHEEEEEDEEEDMDMEGKNDEEAYADMDFAGEIEREVSKKQTKKKKKKRKGDMSSEEEEEEEESVVSEDEEENEEKVYNYDDMDEEMWEDSEGEEEEEEEEGEEGGVMTDTVSEVELEKMLLQNMSENDSDKEESGGEEEEVSQGKKNKRHNRDKLSLKGKFDASKMFAAADEFSHILLEGEEEKGNHKKQLAWERVKSDGHTKFGSRGRGRGGGGRGRRGGGGGSGGRGGGGRGESRTNRIGEKRRKRGGGGGYESVTKKSRLSQRFGRGRGKGKEKRKKSRT